MSRPQPSTFVVPPLNQPAAATSKVVRKPKPFVIVPAAMVINDARELIEPHWLPAIDAATD
jgi:hypothetical protein